jgi:hypothetical protein
MNVMSENVGQIANTSDCSPPAYQRPFQSRVRTFLRAEEFGFSRAACSSQNRGTAGPSVEPEQALPKRALPHACHLKNRWLNFFTGPCGNARSQTGISVQSPAGDNKRESGGSPPPFHTFPPLLCQSITLALAAWPLFITNLCCRFGGAAPCLFFVFAA